VELDDRIEDDDYVVFTVATEQPTGIPAIYVDAAVVLTFLKEQMTADMSVYSRPAWEFGEEGGAPDAAPLR
jgi:hypothetical protein